MGAASRRRHLVGARQRLIPGQGPRSERDGAGHHGIGRDVAHYLVEGILLPTLQELDQVGRQMARPVCRDVHDPRIDDGGDESVLEGERARQPISSLARAVACQLAGVDVGARDESVDHRRQYSLPIVDDQAFELRARSGRVAEPLVSLLLNLLAYSNERWRRDG
jgi:hypothetical protein